MLTKLALAFFLMVNGSPVGPLGVAVVVNPFPTEQACKDFVASDEGATLKGHAEEFGRDHFKDEAIVVVPECVVLDEQPTVVPKPEERGASMPGPGTGGGVS